MPIIARNDAFTEMFWSHSWDETALGRAETWPDPLRCFVHYMLELGQPMMMTWGPSDLLLFNAAYSAILGPNHRESLGRPVREAWASEWAAVAPYFEPARAGEATTGEDVPFRTWASEFNEVRYYTFHYTPIREADGSTIGVTCICHDTTDKVTAEAEVAFGREALSDWFERAPGFVAMLEGPSHRFVLANAACRRIIGERNPIGKTVAEAVPEVLSQGIVEMLDQVYRTGKPFTAKAYPVRLPARHGVQVTRYIDVVYAPRRGRNGEIIGLINEGHDVTEHIAMIERARELQNDLIHLSRVSAMGAMASTLAHELNQPLTAITNLAAAARRLLQRGEHEQVMPALEAISDGALRAGKIIRNVRAMSLKRDAAEHEIDLGETVRDTIRLLDEKDQERVTESIAPGLTAIGDPIQIQQVILNLFQNALEATADRRDGQVTIRAARVGEDLRVSVEDNGPGIAAEPVSAVFESFVTTKPDGMGIGLAISRTIVEAHGGRLSAENRPEGGAAFAFTMRMPPAQ